MTHWTPPPASVLTCPAVTLPVGVLGDILGKRPLRPRGVIYQTCPRPLASAPLGQDQTQASDSKHRLFTGLWGSFTKNTSCAEGNASRKPTHSDTGQLPPPLRALLPSLLPQELPGLSKGETDYEGLSRRPEHAESRVEPSLPLFFRKAWDLTWGAVGAESLLSPRLLGHTSHTQ